MHLAIINQFPEREAREIKKLVIHRSQIHLLTNRHSCAFSIRDKVRKPCFRFSRTHSGTDHFAILTSALAMIHERSQRHVCMRSFSDLLPLDGFTDPAVIATKRSSSVTISGAEEGSRSVAVPGPEAFQHYLSAQLKKPGIQPGLEQQEPLASTSELRGLGGAWLGMLTVSWCSPKSHVFDGVTRHGSSAAFQLADITGDLLQTLIEDETSLREECHVSYALCQCSRATSKNPA